jgi:hypothetical protein
MINRTGKEKGADFKSQIFSLKWAFSRAVDFKSEISNFKLLFRRKEGDADIRG